MVILLCLESLRLPGMGDSGMFNPSEHDQGVNGIKRAWDINLCFYWPSERGYDRVLEALKSIGFGRHTSRTSVTSKA